MSNQSDELLTLVEKLKSDNFHEQTEAINQLWRKRWIKKTIRLLTEHLQEERDYYWRYNTIKALGQLGPAAKDAVPAMVALWDYPNPDLFFGSHDIIMDMGIAAIPYLRRCLNDKKNEGERANILALIGRCRRMGRTERSFNCFVRSILLPTFKAKEIAQDEQVKGGGQPC